MQLFLEKNGNKYIIEVYCLKYYEQNEKILVGDRTLVKEFINCLDFYLIVFEVWTENKSSMSFRIFYKSSQFTVIKMLVLL